MKNEYNKNSENLNKERLSEYAHAGIHEAEEKVKEKAQETSAGFEKQFNYGQEKLSRLVSGIDQRLRKDPWPIVLGVSIGCILLGTILGALKRND